MKTLIIAEKPSVAKDIAAALGGFTQPTRDYFERADIIISSAIGHVATIDVPEAKSFPALPIIPNKFSIVPVEKTKTRLFMLRDLIKRADITQVVNCCDAGREGELIFHYIYEYVGAKKPVFRMWMQSMTADSIRAAYKDIKPAKNYDGLRDAAQCRSESDWLVGINGSRALSKFLRKTTGDTQTSSVGRVQTPTLALIVHRELSIKNFAPQDFFEVHGTFNAAAGEYKGRWKSHQNKTNIDGTFDEEKSFRFSTHAEAEIVAKRCNNPNNNVQIQEESKPVFKAAPSLFDLTTLQREANKSFGFTATETLKIAQSLYETHKATSYPRTDSSALPEDYVDTAKNIIKSFTGTGFDSVSGFDFIAQAVIDNDWVKPNKKVFNNDKISDHFAIIPTGQNHKSNFSEDEATIYNLIVRRFIAVFYPAAEYLKTTRISTILTEEIDKTDAFYSSGSILKSAGWLAVYGNTTNSANNAENNDKEAESTLVAVKADEIVKIKTVDVKALKTKAPAYYNEASLLGAMEKASGEITDDDEAKKAMSEKGLGTPATRAAIIEGLVNKVYIERKAKQIRPSARAVELIQILEKIGLTALTSAKTTGEWEHKLALMDKGNYARPEFMAEIADVTRLIVATFAGHASNAPIANPCPDCGNALLRRESKHKKNEFYWACSNYPNCKTTLTDAKGKPGAKKIAAVASNEFFCAECGKGLVMRQGISKKTAKPYKMWACSGFPKCKAKPLDDVNGKPVSKGDLN